MERERPLVLCVVVLCCSAESSVRVSVNGLVDAQMESFFVRVSVKRRRPLVLCVVVLCCSAESSVRVSVNGGADGAVETPCIMCCCFVLLCRVFC